MSPASTDRMLASPQPHGGVRLSTARSVGRDGTRLGHHGRVSDGRFGLDAYDAQWQAVRFGAPWNGFATPVVSKTTMCAILATVSDGHRWDGDTVVLWPTIDLSADDEPDAETESRVVPDADGNYDLGVLGWTFAHS